MIAKDGGYGTRFETLKIEGQGVYIGSVDASLCRHGLGVLISQGTKIVDGEWKQDEFHGIGTQVYQDGRSYVGEHSHGEKHGTGRFIDNDRQVLGQFEDGVIQGIAIVQFPSQGKKLSGYFSNGQLSGFGLVKTRMGDSSYSLRAFFENGVATSIGSEQVDDKMYEGQFENSKKSGAGQYTDPAYPNGGMRYLGYFEGSAFSTYGIQRVGQEFTYEGGFDRGVKAGIGRMMSKRHGCTYIGEFRDDVQHGFGKYQDSFGSYVGYWKDNVRTGLGGLKEANRTYIGEWKDDQRHGVGCEYSENFTFRGEWAKDRPHGKGVLTTKDGEKCVIYSRGVLVNEVANTDPETFMDGLDEPDTEGFKEKAGLKIAEYERYIVEESSKLRHRFDHLGLHRLRDSENQFKKDMSEVKSKFVDIMRTVEANKRALQDKIIRSGVDVARLSALSETIKFAKTAQDSSLPQNFTAVAPVQAMSIDSPTKVRVTGARTENPTDPFIPVDSKVSAVKPPSNVPEVTPVHSLPHSKVQSGYVSYSPDKNDISRAENRSWKGRLQDPNFSPDVTPDKPRSNQDFITQNLAQLKTQVGAVSNTRYGPYELTDPAFPNSTFKITPMKTNTADQHESEKRAYIEAFNQDGHMMRSPYNDPTLAYSDTSRLEPSQANSPFKFSPSAQKQPTTTTQKSWAAPISNTINITDLPVADSSTQNSKDVNRPISSFMPGGQGSTGATQPRRDAADLVSVNEKWAEGMKEESSLGTF